MLATDKIKEELNKVLSDVANTLNITNYELKPNISMNYGDGFVSLFFTGQIIDKISSKTINVAIKKRPPQDDFNFLDLFINEKNFYEKLSPELNIIQHKHKIHKIFDNIPQYFCSNIETDIYIAMRNIKFDGYELHDKMQYLNKEHLEFIFTVYSKFHALTFVLKKRDINKYNELSNALSDVFVKLGDAFLEEIEPPVKAVVKYLHGDVHDKVKVLSDNLRECFLKSIEYSGKYNCITHGDCWSNNMMFKYSDSGKLEDLKLIDFQLSRSSTPVHDLSYFFYSGASKQDFDNLDEYLTLYHQHFISYCKELGYNSDDLLPLETLKKEWKENALLGVFLSIFLWNIKLLPKEKFQNDILDNSTSEEEKRRLWAKVAEEVYTSDNFKEKTINIILHAVERGIIN